MFEKMFQLLFENAGDKGNGAGEKIPYTADEDLKFLRQNADEQNEEETEEAEEEPETTEEVEEDGTEEDTEGTEEDTEDTEEDTEEEEEQTEEDKEISSLVTAQDLKKKLGEDVFKKAPELRGIVYREQQYSQLFASPKEAQDALTRSESFQDMENDLISGDSKPLLDALKKTDGMDFNRFAANLLPALKEIDKDTYYKVVLVPFKQILRSAIRASQKNGDKNLGYAAQHLHNFVFDNTNIDEKAEFEGDTTKKSPEQEKYEKRLNELDARDHRNFKVAVDTEWLGSVQKSFMDGLDPDNIFSDWTKNKMLEDAIGKLNQQLTADPRYMKNIEALWRNAKANGYSSDFKSRIVNAALARAKQIIPQIRTELRSEALAERRRRIKAKGEKKIVVAKGSSSDRRDLGKRKDPRKTSEMSEMDVIRSR